MILIDGSNALPALGEDRLDDEARRRLVTAVASIARQRRTRAIVVFDGSPSTSFARSLGDVTVRFSGAGSGDDLIVAIVSQERSQWTVVTRDRELRSRLRGRQVRFEDPRILASGEPARSSEENDWEAWFSDPANRIS